MGEGVEETFHKDLRTTPKWKQEKEEEEEDDDDEEEYGEEAWGQGKGWPVVLAGFIINMLANVGFSGYGMLFSPRLLELGSSPGFMAGLANAMLAAAYLLCLPLPPLLHRWGCRRLLLPIGFFYSATFTVAALVFSTPGPLAVASIFAGSCRQVIFLVVQMAVCRSFERGRPLAMGLAMAGSAASQIMIPPLLAFMQSHYNPRTVLLMTSVLLLHICIAAILLPSDADPSAPLRVEYLAVIRQREVALLCLILAISNATLSVFWTTVPLALLDTGHNLRDMVVYFIMSGIGNLITRVVIGLVLCHLGRSSTTVRLACVLAAAAIPTWYWCQRLAWRMVWMFVCGGSSGLVTGLASLVVLEVAGLKLQPEALSLINLSTGIASLLVGQIVDLAREVTGSYASKLHATSALLMLTQVLWELLDAQTNRGLSSTTLSHPITKEEKETKGAQKEHLLPYETIIRRTVP